MSLDGAARYSNLSDDEDKYEEGQEDSEEDIDELDYATQAAARPLLTPLDDSEEAGGQQVGTTLQEHAIELDPWEALQDFKKKAIGLKKSLGIGQRRDRGFCPICGGKVRSGAHECVQAKWKVQEGRLADAVRCDGNAHFRAGRFEDAVSSYSRALAHSPEDPRLWSNRSMAHFKLMRLPEALADADAAILRAPTFFKGYLRRAQVLEARDDFRGVVATWESALSGCPRSEDQPRCRARLATARGRLAAAEQAGELPEPFAALALASRRLQRGPGASPGSVAEARRLLEQAERAKAEGNREVSAQCWEGARACYSRGLQLACFSCVERCAELEREQAMVEAALMSNMALCALRTGRRSEAEELCTKVLALDPRNVKARFRLATSLAEGEDYSAAMGQVDLALVFQPKEGALVKLRRQLLAEHKAARRREKEQCSRMFRT